MFIFNMTALTIVPTFKGVGLYSATFLHVGTMVNAPLCNSLYFFLYFLCHPYTLTIFVENYYFFTKHLRRNGEMPYAKCIHLFQGEVKTSLQVPSTGLSAPLCYIAALTLYTSMFTAASLVAFSDAYKGYGYGKKANTYCTAEDKAKMAVKMAD